MYNVSRLHAKMVDMHHTNVEHNYEMAAAVRMCRHHLLHGRLFGHFAVSTKPRDLCEVEVPFHFLTPLIARSFVALVRPRRRRNDELVSHLEVNERPQRRESPTKKYKLDGTVAATHELFE